MLLRVVALCSLASALVPGTPTRVPKRVAQVLAARRRTREERFAIANADPDSGEGLRIRSTLDDTDIVYDAFHVFDRPDPVTVVFLPSLASERLNAVSTTVRDWCKRLHYSFVCADWHGTGRSVGEVRNATITRWLADTKTLIEEVVVQQSPRRKIVLVGAGVGGWIACLVAMRYPELCKGIVGLAADPDFTEDLLLRKLPKETIDEIMAGGKVIKWGNTEYPITRELVEDARNHLILRGPPQGLPIDCPMRILHGLLDEEVPYETAVRLANRVRTNDVIVNLFRTRHHMSDIHDFPTTLTAIQDCIECIHIYPLYTPATG